MVGALGVELDVDVVMVLIVVVVVVEVEVLLLLIIVLADGKTHCRVVDRIVDEAGTPGVVLVVVVVVVVGVAVVVVDRVRSCLQAMATSSQCIQSCTPQSACVHWSSDVSEPVQRTSSSQICPVLRRYLLRIFRPDDLYAHASVHNN